MKPGKTDHATGLAEQPEPFTGQPGSAIEREAALNRILRAAMQAPGLKDALQQSLDILLGVSWLSIENKGAVFLVGDEPSTLQLFVERNLSPELLTLCAKVPFGHCLCGRAALTRETQHACCVDEHHETRFDGMAPHGHYNVPILSDASLLGVLVLYLPQGHAGTRNEIEFVEAVADILALTIERKRREEQLREAARLGWIFEESLNEIYVFDTESLRFLDANRAAQRNSGYSEQKLRAMTPVDLKPEFDEQAFRALIAPLAQDSTRRLEFQSTHRRKDGSTYPVQVQLQLVTEGRPSFVAIINDISSRVQAETERRRAETLLGAALEALPGGFCVWDCEGRLALFNQQYRRLYAASAPAIKVGARFEDILRYGLAQGQYPDAVGREEEWLVERLAQHQSDATDLEQQLPDGRWLRVLERKMPDGGIVGFRFDITERHRQREEVKAQRDKAQAANRAKSEFLANMSHEVRTPLNGVIGLAEVLEARVEGPAQRELAQTIARLGHELLAIFNDILELSRIGEGKLDLAEGPVSLSRLAEKLREAHACDARQRGIGFEVFTSLGGDGEFRGDEIQIYDILKNLVSNAVKFTESGEVSVLLKVDAKGRLVLEVRDTGIGMSAEERARAFELFAQVNGSMTRRVGGTGLGLNIVQKLSDRMGGEFTLDSMPGRGTTARVILPARTALYQNPRNLP